MITSTGRIVSGEEWDRLRKESNAKWRAFYAELEARPDRCGHCRFWQENPGYRLRLQTAALEGNLAVSLDPDTVYAPSKDEGWCRQWPEPLKASHLDWCGQFEARPTRAEDETGETE